VDKVASAPLAGGGGAQACVDCGAAGADARSPFEVLGPRVPLLVVSPWVRRGSLIRAPAPGNTTAGASATAAGQPPRRYEHSSIAASLLAHFGVDASLLGQRAAWALPLHHVWAAMEAARHDCPRRLQGVPAPLPATPATAHIRGGNNPLTPLQRSILHLLDGVTGYAASPAEGEDGWEWEGANTELGAAVYARSAVARRLQWSAEDEARFVKPRLTIRELFPVMLGQAKIPDLSHGVGRHARGAGAQASMVPVAAPQVAAQ
jgi:hypothetical protein